MAESTHKSKQKCKGCNFLIKSDKLLVHLNHPKVKCKEAYSKDEYSLVYDLWMQTKMAIRIQEQDKIKCRGCNFDLDKLNLLWHLNDKKVDCKKIYSKDEYQHIFEFWLFHEENPSKPNEIESDECANSSNDVDSDKGETIFDNKIPREVCKGCKKSLKINTIMKHLSALPKCHGMYSNQELASIKTRIINFRNNARRIRRRTDSISMSKSSETLEEIICKGCKSKCFINTIMNHLAKRSECRGQYSNQEFHNVERKCADYQKAKRSSRDRDRYKDNNRRSAISQTKDTVR